jgi:hypothetical protein
LGKFRITASRLLIPAKERTSPHVDWTLEWSGQVKSERDILRRIYPVWTMHGPVEAEERGDGYGLEWVDEGTLGEIVLTGRVGGRFRCLFKLLPVPASRVIFCQDRWNQWKGLVDRNDPRDPLRHMGWRVWAKGEGELWRPTKNSIAFRIEGTYGMT